MPSQRARSDQALSKAAQAAIAALQPIEQSGVAIAILRDGKPVWAKGFGLRDRAAGTRVTPSTVFPVGSASKAFTAMQLSISAAGRQFSLDQPIVDFAADFAMQEGKASSDMRLVDMLSHRSGLPRYDTLWYLGPFSRPQLYFRLRSLAQIPGAFGTTFLYNNLMYTAAGHLLEGLTGTAWEEHVRTSILQPLDMADTSFTLADMVAGKNFARGYQKDVPVPFKDYGSIGPAGAINSTVLDLARWVQLFLAKGLTAGGDRLLDEAALEHLYSRQTDTGNGSLFYGLGWYVGSLQGEPYVFHDGVADGFTAYVSFLPGRKLGVIVLTNQHTSLQGTLNDMWPRKLAESLYDVLLHGEATGLELPGFPDAALSPLPAAALLAGRPAAGVAADSVTGLYGNGGFGDMTISRFGAGLILSYFGHRWPLERLLDDFFRARIHAYATDFNLVGRFVRDGSGTVSGFAVALTREAAAAPVIFVRR